MNNIEEMWFFNQSGDTNTSIIETCKTNHPKTIVIVTDTEWYWNIEPEHINALKTEGVENIKIVYGSFPCEYYNNLYENLNLPIENIINWPTFWFNWGELLLRNSVDYRVQTYDNFKYPFIFLNNKSHDHRCALIDNIAKFNLLDKGIVTWNKTPYPNLDYNFKYYNNEFRGLNDDFVNKLDSFLICKEQHESFLHVIGEATTQVPFITEKTIIPILYKKPFVVIGHDDFSKCLKNLGFELFDELIDYGFENIKDIDSKALSLVYSNLVNLSVEKDLYGLYKKLLPKIEHNYNRAFEIILDEKYIPDIIKKQISLIKHDKYLVPVYGRHDFFLTQIKNKQILYPYD